MSLFCKNEPIFIFDFFSHRISDRGGGIPENQMEEIFRYSVSSTPAEDEELLQEGSSMLGGFVDAANVTAVGGRISGHGFGLPSSRAYTEFLGGGLTLVPMVGLGTDVFLKIAHITSDTIKI